jgi:galacturan 1,4-alpha-galacturonidase
MQAWSALCGANQGNPTLMVPVGHSFFVHQMIFKGPCKSQNLHIQVKKSIFYQMFN